MRYRDVNSMKRIEKRIGVHYNKTEVSDMASSLRVNFKGLLNEITLPEYKCLWPVFESVVNSIQSINDTVNCNNGKITVKAIRDQCVIGEVSNAPYNTFEIIDNGCGFSQQNYNSFLEAYTPLKITKGCKGIGRFLWLKAFEYVEIESVYCENDTWYKRRFTFSESDFISPEDNVETTDSHEAFTTVRLVGYKEKYQKNCSVSIEPIAKKLIEHCMMYFISDTCPEIDIQDEKDHVILNDFFQKHIKDTLHCDEFEIGEKTFSIYHIQMKENATRHELHLCAGDREVESLDLRKKITNLNSKLFDDDGNEYYYVGYITGKYLDESVNTNRTAFNIEQNHSLTNPITKEDIFETSRNFVELYLGEDLKKIQAQKEEQINNYVNYHKPQYRFLLNAKPQIINDLPSGLKDEELEIELHKQTQKWEKEIKELGIEIEKESKEKTKSIDDFELIFDKYCSNISELSRVSLSEYVIRRKTILDMFEKALSWDDDNRFQKEEIIHSLICPMRHSSNDVPFDEMNLWIIDEKLAFHNYLASDQQLKSIPVIDSNSKDRVDIVAFDHALSYSSEADQFNSISIIELKRPGRDDYSATGKDKDPVEQVLRYVKEIRDGKAKQANGRSFGNVNATPFYCYIIADITDSLADRAENAGYTKTPDGEGYYGFNHNRNAFIEIISYSKLLRDAKRSNQVFFEKLFNPKAEEIKLPN